MANQKVLSGGLLLAVGTVLILWSGVNWNGELLTMAAAAVASMLLAAGSLLVGTSGDGRAV